MTVVAAPSKANTHFVLTVAAVLPRSAAAQPYHALWLDLPRSVPGGSSAIWELAFERAAGVAFRIPGGKPHGTSNLSAL